jgi:outer membrane protein
VAGEDEPADKVAAAAMAHRPDLSGLQAQVRALDLIVSSQRGGYFPALGASAAVTEAGPEVNQLAWNWNVGINLSWGFFQGGVTRAAVRQAEANRDALKAQLDTAELAARVQIETAQLAIRAAKSGLEAAREARANAQLRLKLAEGRYQTGVGNIIELGDAQLQATTAAGQEVQSEYQLATARAQLLRALAQD